MNKQEFWDIYRSSQVKITLSDDMKQNILSHVTHQEKQREDYGEESTLHEGREKNVLHRVQGGSSSRRRKARFALPIAACLALCVMVVVSLANVGGLLGKPDFAVRAYAAETDSILAMGNENQIIFSKNPLEIGRMTKEAVGYSSVGSFTGCLFRIEGNDITRMQASISTGALYQQSTEEITPGENPERWSEFINWKPSKVGSGLEKYYEKYDAVTSLGSTDDLPKDSPDKKIKVGLTKKLGSTIDVPMSENSSEMSFGFWANEDYSDISAGFGDEVLDLFDGATLTVTVTFADGHTATQLIELHTGDAKSSWTEDETGRTPGKLIITPELIDAKNTTLEDSEYTHIIYGLVKETNHNPFPGSLAKANEFANEVTPFPVEEVFQRRDIVEALGINIDPKNIHSSSETAKIKRATEDSKGNYPQLFSISHVTAQKSKELPKGVSLSDVECSMGDWEYFNFVVDKVDGFTLNEVGTPSDGFSWVSMEATITNDSDSEEKSFDRGDSYGQLATQDANKQIVGVNGRSFILKNDSINDSQMTFKPHESKTLRWMVIVPDSVLEDPTLFFYLRDILDSNYDLGDTLDSNYDGKTGEASTPEGFEIKF